MSASFAGRIATLLLAIFIWIAPAKADELRPSSIEFVQRDATNWHLGWKQNLARAADAQLRVPVIPDGCEIATEPVGRKGAMALIGHAAVTCKTPIAGGQLGWSELVGEDALLRVVPQDTPTQAFRLTPDQPLATIAAEPGTWQVWQSYFPIGIVHILEGWDHLLFVIALVLLVGRPWAVVKAVTAFTIAHSLTLAAVTLGFFGLPSRPVEAVIALSIVFLAVELARGDPATWTRRFPWAVAFAFGLFHGFGFAGALRDIGLPQGEIPSALIAFNLGVEAGQLLVIAAVLLVRAAISRWAPKAEGPALKLTTYAIGTIASFWLIDRLIA